MKRWKEILGLLGAVILLLSSGAHSILGWRDLGGRLTRAGAPADLINGMRIGWLFGGACMLAFAVIAAGICISRLRGGSASTFPIAVISVLYLAFGAWALAISGNPFFMIFIVPGVLLLLASLPRRA